MCGRPERTNDYRLLRLHTTSLVGRTRPYVDRGSAPFFWWLTAAGARLIEGSAPVLGKTVPNPLFLAHASATAGFYLGLVVHGPDVGLSPTLWRRDEDAWEEWSNSSGFRHVGSHKVRPDTLVELQHSGDEHPVRAFIEIDLGTMDQGRLSSKVYRHVAYEESGPWFERHGHCPGLLLLTTSDARARTFLKRAHKPLHISERATFGSNNTSRAVGQPVDRCGVPLTGETEFLLQKVG